LKGFVDGNCDFYTFPRPTVTRSSWENATEGPLTGIEPAPAALTFQYSAGLALFSIQQTDLTSFSEDGRGVKWLCN
jgi:hypothetical protein